MRSIKKIISESQKVNHVEYRREFSSIDDDACDYSFPCEKNGTLIHDKFYDSWIENYHYCVSHPDEYEDMGIITMKWEYTEPTHALCSCGREVFLSGDTCCGGCGQWYNMFGQPIKNPFEWDENCDDDYFEAKDEGFC